LTRIKGNLGSDPGGLAYEIEAYRIGSESEPDGIGTSRVKWHDGAIVKTADQLYAASTADRGGRKRDARERDDAESLLRELLAGGRMPVKEIEAEAKSARARGMVGAMSVKAGFSPAVWYWVLPVGVPEAPKDDPNLAANAAPLEALNHPTGDVLGGATFPPAASILVTHHSNLIDVAVALKRAQREGRCDHSRLPSRRY
jgi:hypothetical protein